MSRFRSDFAGATYLPHLKVHVSDHLATPYGILSRRNPKVVVSKLCAQGIVSLPNEKQNQRAREREMRLACFSKLNIRMVRGSLHRLVRLLCCHCGYLNTRWATVASRFQ